MFSHRLSVCLSVHSSDMIPVSGAQMLSNLSVPLSLCYLSNLGLLTWRSSIPKKTCHAPNIAILQNDSPICAIRNSSSIRRLPPTTAKGVAVFEGRPIR